MIEVSLEGNSLVKSTRYLIVISFQGGICCSNRLNDSLLVRSRYPATHTGKGKKLSGSVFYWVIQKKFLECTLSEEIRKKEYPFEIG